MASFWHPQVLYEILLLSLYYSVGWHGATSQAQEVLQQYFQPRPYKGRSFWAVKPAVMHISHQHWGCRLPRWMRSFPPIDFDRIPTARFYSRGEALWDPGVVYSTLPSILCNTEVLSALYQRHGTQPRRKIPGALPGPWFDPDWSAVASIDPAVDFGSCFGRNWAKKIGMIKSRGVGAYWNW